MIRFPLQNDAAGDNRIGAVVRGHLSHNNRYLKRARHVQNGDCCLGCKREQLLHHVIDETIHVFSIKSACYNAKPAFPLVPSWATWSCLRHLAMTNDK